MNRLLTFFLAATLLTGCASMYVTADQIRGLQEGMTETEVVERIGRPTDINRTEASYGSSAQFVYSNYGQQYEAAYVYFEDGRLTSVQY